MKIFLNFEFFWSAGLWPASPISFRDFKDSLWISLLFVQHLISFSEFENFVGRSASLKNFLLGILNIFRSAGLWPAANSFVRDFEIFWDIWLSANPKHFY